MSLEKAKVLAEWLEDNYGESKLLLRLAFIRARDLAFSPTYIHTDASRTVNLAEKLLIIRGRL